MHAHPYPFDLLSSKPCSRQLQWRRACPQRMLVLFAVLCERLRCASGACVYMVCGEYSSMQTRMCDGRSGWSVL